MADANLSPHIVVISGPSMSHMTPLAELTKLIVLRHHFTATFVTFSGVPFSLPSSISTIQFPPQDLPTSPIQFSVTIARSAPLLREILISLRRTTRITAVILNLANRDFLSVVKELEIPSYIFIACNLFFLSFMLHLPTLNEITVGDFRDLPEPLRLPGCVPLKGEDFLEPFQKRDSEACAWMVQMAKLYDLFDGILVNSFEAIEAGAAKGFKERGSGKPPVWPIGPLTWYESNLDSEEGSDKCIEWLNQQPSQSVVLICFGSGGILSREQTRELALGLEMSEHRFLWVVRVPSDTELSGNFFHANHSSDDPLSFLPEGFMERTKGRGMMVPSWAPQQKVLRHHATCGFVSHCGWNSILESVVNGVPMVAWPLYAEQRMNAVLIVEGVKVALRANVGVDGVVRRGDVANVVKELMEGEKGKEVRLRMEEMKIEATRAMGKDGSSYKAQEEVVSILKDLVSTSVV